MPKVKELPKESDTQVEEVTSPTPTVIPTSKPDSKHPIFNFFAQFLVVAAVFFVIGFVLGGKGLEVERKGVVPNITVENKQPQTQTIDFSLFWNVFDTLPKKYLTKENIDGQKMLYGAISGMVRSLGDPYTAFLDPKQNDAVRSEIAGEYEGIGIQIGFNKEKRLVVIAPISDSPAQKAGLRAKDLIHKIGEEDTFEMTLPEAVDLIRGPSGSKIKLSLQHEGEDKPYDIEIERAQIKVKSVEVSYRDTVGGEKIAIIKVNRFGEKTDNEWDASVTEVIGSTADGVIVDMRNNPGGLLSSSIHLGSEFVRGTIVKQEYADGSISNLNADHEGRLLKIPVTVLINGGSASASEIFAGAIQDNGRGDIVGEKSFGKGTVQDVIDFPGGSGLHVTIARWLTPKGKSIHDVGITPDVIIEAPEGGETEADPQLDKALETFK